MYSSARESLSLLEAFKMEEKQRVLSLLPSIAAADCTVTERNGPDHEPFLFWATRHGWLDVVKELLSVYDCDPRREDSVGCTVLHVACLHDRLDMVKYYTSTFCMDL